MATIVVLSIFAMAFAFMVYVLIELHLEAKRPRSAPSQLPKGVVVFRGSFTVTPRSSAVAHQNNSVNDVAPRTRKLNSGKLVVLPLGIRRLAAKRAARS